MTVQPGERPCLMAQGKESPASFACQHAPLCQVSCGLVYSDRFLLTWTMYACTRFCHYCEILCLWIWTQIPRVHSSVVRAADCRSASPWFNSWFTFVIGSDTLTNPTTFKHFLIFETFFLFFSFFLNIFFLIFSFFKKHFLIFETFFLFFSFFQFF